MAGSGTTLRPSELQGADIYDALREYIIGDYEARSMTLKNRQLGKAAVFLEGHVDVYFKECIFNQIFAVGEPGPRFEGDTRGTSENPEPFPEYGYNVITFENCVINAPLTCKKNSTMIFRGGQINQPITLEDNSRIILYPGVRITNKIDAKNNCEIIVDNAIIVSAPYFVEGENGVLVHVRSADVVQPVKFVTLTKRSKLVVDQASQIQTAEELAVLSENSAAEIRNVDNITTSMTTIKMSENSKLEAYGIKEWTTSEKAVEATSSTAELRDINNLISSQTMFTGASRSKISVAIAQQLTSSEAIADLSSTSSGIFSGVQTTTSSQTIYKLSQSTLTILDAEETTAGEKVVEGLKSNIYISDSNKFTASGGEVISGSETNVTIQNTKELVSSTSDTISIIKGNVSDFSGQKRVSSSSNAYKVSEGSVSIHDIDQVQASSSCFDLTKCKAKVFGIQQLEGEKAFNIFESSLTTYKLGGLSLNSNFMVGTFSDDNMVSIYDIDAISTSDAAFVLSGNVRRAVISDIPTISSVASAVSANFERGELLISNCPAIEGISAPAIDIHGNANVEVRNGDTISSAGGPALSITARNFILSNFSTVFGLLTSSINGEEGIFIHDIDLISSPTERALAINCDPGCELRVSKISTIQGQTGGVMLHLGGSFSFRATSIVSSAGDAVLVDFSDISEGIIEAALIQAADGMAVGITGLEGKIKCIVDSMLASSAPAVFSASGNGEVFLKFNSIVGSGTPDGVLMNGVTAYIDGGGSGSISVSG